jgi:hypothetical protein
VSDLKLTVTSWGEVAIDKREMRALMRAAGNDVKNKTGRLINQGQGGGRNYPAHGATQYRPAAPAYRASAPGQPPAAPTRALRGSLKTYVYKSAEGFAVRARQFYALFLEAGAKGGGNRFGGRPRAAAAWRASGRRQRARGRYTTRVLEPRPFLDKVMAQEAPNITRRLRDAFAKSLTWRQTKAP